MLQQSEIVFHHFVSHDCHVILCIGSLLPKISDKDFFILTHKNTTGYLVCYTF